MVTNADLNTLCNSCGHSGGKHGRETIESSSGCGIPECLCGSFQAPASHRLASFSPAPSFPIESPFVYQTGPDPRIGGQLTKDLIVKAIETVSKYPNKITNKCTELNLKLLQKNEGYGDSFSKSRMGVDAVKCNLIRVSDKFSRLENLLSDPNKKPGDESVYDTCLDIAGYMVLVCILLDEQG